MRFLQCVLAWATCILMAHSSLHAQAISGPFSNIRFVHHTFQKGVKGVAVYFDMDLRDMKSDSSVAVAGFIADAEGQPTMATPDALNHQGAGGVLRDSFAVTLPKTNPLQRQLGLFFPYYAISLSQGSHTRFLQIKLVSRANGSVVQETPPMEFKIQMPGRRMHRLQMNELEVLETDINGETWDYVLLSAREIHPELEWAIFRGNTLIFRSDKVRNSLRMDIDPVKNVSPLFGLADGDSITLRVEDFDLMTSSDLIGSKKFSPHSVDRPSNMSYEEPFGRIKTCKFLLEETVLPAFQVQEMTVNDHARYQGVSGYQVKLQYLVDPYPSDGKLRIGVEAPGPEKARTAQYVFMQEGPALFSMDQHLVLQAPSGTLEFFIPWYAFPMMKLNMLRLAAELKFDNGNRYPIGWFTEKWKGLPHAFADFDFGEQRIAADSSNGVNGFRIQTEYALSQRYFADLKDAYVEVRPSFFGASGPIPFESLSISDSKGVFSKLRDPIRIPADQDSSTLELFLPFWVLDQAGEVNLRVGFVATLYRGQDETVIGSTGTDIPVQIPERTIFDLQVKDLVCRRDLLDEDGMGIWWRVIVGHETMYASRVVRNTHRPQWKSTENARLYLCEGDRFTLEVLRRNPEGRDELLDSWTGKADQLPITAGKSGTLKLSNVKKLNFRMVAQ